MENEYDIGRVIQPIMGGTKLVLTHELLTRSIRHSSTVQLIVDMFFVNLDSNDPAWEGPRIQIERVTWKK